VGERTLFQRIVVFFPAITTSMGALQALRSKKGQETENGDLAGLDSRRESSARRTRVRRVITDGAPDVGRRRDPGSSG